MANQAALGRPPELRLYAIWAERGLLCPERPQMVGTEYGRDFWEAVLRWARRDQKWRPYFDKTSFRIWGSPVASKLTRPCAAVSEGDIRRLAQVVLEQHGDGAYLHLADMLGTSLGDGDVAEFAKWLRVLDAMGRLEATKPADAVLH